MRQNRVATTLEYGKHYIYHCEECGEERNTCTCTDPDYETVDKTIRIDEVMDSDQ